MNTYSSLLSTWPMMEQDRYSSQGQNCMSEQNSISLSTYYSRDSCIGSLQCQAKVSCFHYNEWQQHCIIASCLAHVVSNILCLSLSFQRGFYCTRCLQDHFETKKKPTNVQNLSIGKCSYIFFLRWRPA
jgi:hypothetical protein